MQARRIQKIAFMNRRYFAFFSKRISEKYGQVCCRYGQNGQPLPKDVVDKTYGSLKEFLTGWKLDPERRMLYRYFYAANYLNAVQFMKDIAKMDHLSTQNTPAFHLTKGELLKVELYSISLSGLSQVDFELAMNINRMNFNEYELDSLQSEENDYKAEVMQIRRRKASEEMQRKLREEFNSNNPEKDQEPDAEAGEGQEDAAKAQSSPNISNKTNQ